MEGEPLDGGITRRILWEEIDRHAPRTERNGFCEVRKLVGAPGDLEGSAADVEQQDLSR